MIIRKHYKSYNYIILKVTSKDEIRIHRRLLFEVSLGKEMSF